MVDDRENLDPEDKKEDSFEFDSAGEAVGYISIAQARVLAMRTARDEPGDYGSEYQEIRMVFDRVGHEEDEDYFYVRLSYQPVSGFQGEPGVEEFVIDKTGTVEFRQIIGMPKPVGSQSGREEAARREQEEPARREREKSPERKRERDEAVRRVRGEEEKVRQEREETFRRWKEKSPQRKREREKAARREQEETARRKQEEVTPQREHEETARRDRKGARHRGRYPPPQPGDQRRDARDLQGLLLNGEGDAEDNIVGGPKHSNFANNAFPSHEFDLMLSNPLFVKSWKSDLERTGGKSDMKDPRFMIVHATTRPK